ncbi:MAG: DUF445 domain-containing protein [Ruminiclostridium sp.]|nr:DUF445 domain-containing protein [Ruminiclostridium sp.]
MEDGMQNRSKANILLSSVLILFAVTTALRFIYKDSFIAGLLAFTAEAALVGGIADWFAVTALFSKPLGFSWHTAIVPNNRERIIEKITYMVGDELLGVDSIKNKLSGLNMTGALLDRLLGSMDRSSLENHVQNLVTDNMKLLDRTKITEDINALIKENLKKENVSDEIRKLLLKAFSEGRHGSWLMLLLGKAVEIARKPASREKIYKILKEQEKYRQETTGAGAFFVKTLLNMSHGSKHTNLFAISGLLQQELVDLLEQLKNPEHPVFKKLMSNSGGLIIELNEADILPQTIQNWKNGILERLDLLEALELMISTVVGSQIYRGEAVAWIAGHLDKYRNDLSQDDEMRAWIDNILKEMLEKIIRSEHYLIGEIVKETLEAFTNERLNQFIEEKVGDDLQWIRINGSIVGASAGMLIYLFTNLVYSPYVVPVIQRLLGIGY